MRRRLLTALSGFLSAPSLFLCLGIAGAWVASAWLGFRVEAASGPGRGTPPYSGWLVEADFVDTMAAVRCVWWRMPEPPAGGPTPTVHSR